MKTTATPFQPSYNKQIRLRTLPGDEVDSNSHSYHGLVCVCLWWTGMNDVLDIKLFFQPSLCVGVDRKTRNEPLGCAELGSRDTIARHPPSTIDSVALQTMIHTEAVEYTKPGSDEGSPPFRSPNEVPFSTVYSLLFVAGHPVNAQLLEHPALLCHLRVVECHVMASAVKLRERQPPHKSVLPGSHS